MKETDTPLPGAGEVLVRVTSIGVNQAEVMGRLGKYKASTGEPPFVPGIEAGGVIESVGDGVDPSRVGERVVLGPGVPRGVDGAHGGTYRSHMVVDARITLRAPDELPDDQLGAVILPYLTSYGCLIQHHGLKPGAVVGIPAATSSVGLAAAQVVKAAGGTAIGFTSSPRKVEALETLETCAFDEVIVTHDEDRNLRPFRRDLKALTGGKGVDVFFDPVAAGAYLQEEVLALAPGGKIYIYGLLGRPDKVDITPLIIKRASIEGWVLNRTVDAGEEVWRGVCDAIFRGFASGAYKQHLDRVFKLEDAQAAHEYLVKGQHIGKLVLVP